MRRFSHATNARGLKMDWTRVVSVSFTRRVLEEDAEIGDEDHEVFEEAFVDLVTNLLIDRPGMSPVFGLGCEAYDGGGAEITYKVWYHGMVEYMNPAGLPREAVYECLHPEERIEDLPSWIRSEA